MSVLAHASAIAGVGYVAYHLSQRSPREAAVHGTGAPEETIAVELPSVSEGAVLSDREVVPEGEKPVAYGGSSVARVDNGSVGKGGEKASQRAVNLAANDDGMRLSPDTLSRLDRDQHQRLKTQKWRASREDRRATPNPMELTFLATGNGEHQERRPDAAFDPSRGSLASASPSVRGGHVGARENDETGGPGATAGASRPGQLLASPGTGVRDGTPGADHRSNARIARGRPDVTEGATTIPSTTNGRPHDTVDSDQEVATTVRALVHASHAGGLAGQGKGGTTGGGDPGAGGTEGRGSIAKPLGSGDGDIIDWNTSDPNLMPYFRQIHAKVDPLWRDAFPRSALAELKQGTVILEFTVSADGSARVSWPPARPSGIDEFDKNCADAIRRASPFPPIPASLGRSSLRIRAPFVAKNPVVK